MKNYIPLFFDFLFILAITTLLIFLPLSYYLQNSYNLLIAFVFGLAITLPTTCIVAQKNNKKLLIGSQKKECALTLQQLATYNVEEIKSLFKKSFNNLNISVEEQKNSLFLPKNNIICAFIMLFDNLTNTHLYSVYTEHKKNKSTVVIFTNTATEENLKFSARFNGLVVYDGANTFNFLKETNNLIELNKEKQKAFFIGFKNNFFTQKNALKFFIFGVMLFLFGFFVPFKLYYAIFGGLMLLASFLCMLLKNKEQKPPNLFF